MRLEEPHIARRARPGQFIHVRCGSSTDPLLRRPFSVHRTGENDIDILYKVVGKGTEILSGKRAGEKIDIMGPLGNGFDIYKDSAALTMLVAGGMGVAPLLGLAERISRNSSSSRNSPGRPGGRLIAVLGAKTKDGLLCADELRALGAEVYEATEDESGPVKKALATEVACDVAKAKNLARREICVYAAGPIGMVKELCSAMRGCGRRSQVSLEEKMACGLGACLGCVVETRAGYKRVCKDGPVFNMRDIL